MVVEGGKAPFLRSGKWRAASQEDRLAKDGLRIRVIHLDSFLDRRRTTSLLMKMRQIRRTVELFRSQAD